MKSFKKEDLKLCDFQFQITHTNTDKFKIGEYIFLKSNPDYPLEVYSINNKEIGVGSYSTQYFFSPECILQYTYRGLLIGKRKYKICLS